jgi:tRNA pseudouridine55 synthase
MDGVLLIDKPEGLTSHDVVQRLRRTSGERTIGHTGTLDPLATGLLPLVVGRATRLASLLTKGDKTYDATVRLGYGTDTDDTEGTALAPPVLVTADHETIQRALEAFRGTFDQQPPSHSAKKVGGRRAYRLARRDVPVELAPVAVTVTQLDWMGRSGDLLQLRVTAGSGFYVRALARDLGAALGCGGHLAALRRVASGVFRVEQATPLDEALALGPDVASRLISPAEALPDLASVQVTARGLWRATHGNPLEPRDLEDRPAPRRRPDPGQPVKILAADGHLVAIAERRGGTLHPVVVLG